MACPTGGGRLGESAGEPYNGSCSAFFSCWASDSWTSPLRPASTSGTTAEVPRKKYILETIGGGVAWIDYDRDGWPDLYLVNGGEWDELLAGNRNVSNALYRNNGDGTFTDVTAGSGLTSPHWGMGAAVGDVDNDGWPDLYLCNFGPNILYRNNGDGTFTDVTAGSGAGNPRWSSSAAFGDYDGDGWIDLYVANYVDFDPHSPRPPECSYRGIMVHCGPKEMVAAPDALYRNRGDGTFSQVTSEAGMEVRPAYGLGAVWGDYDNDGDTDLYVANDSMANFLFRNRGDGRFLDVAALGGGRLQPGRPRAGGHGSDLRRLRPGRLSGSVRHQLLRRLPHPLPQPERKTVSRRHLRRGSRVPQLAVPGLGGPLRRSGQRRLAGPVRFQRTHLSAGGRLRDGHPLRPAQARFSESGERENSGRQREEWGEDLSKTWSSRGAAFADFDNDGDLDVAVNNLDARPSLFRNDGAGDAGHWLNLALKGGPTNRSAIGTRGDPSGRRLEPVAGGPGRIQLPGHQRLPAPFRPGRVVGGE